MNAVTPARHACQTVLECRAKGRRPEKTITSRIRTPREALGRSLGHPGSKNESKFPLATTAPFATFD